MVSGMRPVSVKGFSSTSMRLLASLFSMICQAMASLSHIRVAVVEVTPVQVRPVGTEQCKVVMVMDLLQSEVSQAGLTAIVY